MASWDDVKGFAKKAAPVAIGIGTGVATQNPAVGLAAYQGSKQVIDSVEGGGGGGGGDVDPAAAQAQSNEFGSLGEKAMGMHQSNTQQSINALAPAQRQAETTRLALKDPGALESRYESALTGPDLAANRQRELGEKSIITQYGAAGGGRSGAAMQANRDLQADIYARSQQRIDTLAGGAQAAKGQRLGQVYDTVRGISQDTAGVRERGGERATGAYVSGQAGRIQGGLDALTNQSAMSADAAKAKAATPDPFETLLKTSLQGYQLYQGGKGGR